MNKYLLFFLFSISICFDSFSQLQSYKKGLVSFEKGYYDIAINELLKVKEIASTELSNLNFTIAESYRLSNRWAQAIPFYEKAFEAGLNSNEAVFYYAYALKTNEDYAKSFAQFEKYIGLKTSDKILNERANREINTLKIIEEIKGKKDEKVFRNLKEINTPNAEFSATVKDGNLVYSSTKKEKIYSNGLPFLGIYKAKINQDLSSIDKTEIFSSTINDLERNEGTPSFSPDGKMMVFARGNSGKKKDVSPDVDLYISRYVPNEGWLEPKLVSASDSAAWDGCPAFSRDGKTLYFSSNREGGVGGLDIYRVNMDASGRFGNPVNMGKVINTAGDEMFPYVSPDAKLFFASDGHPGLGKLDIFVAVRSGGKIYIENLGLPYNSAMDDFAYSIDENENVFFSSNRPGGVGDDDIYFYQAPPKPELVVEKPKVDDPNDPESPNYKRNQNSKIVNYLLAGKVNGRLNNEAYSPLADARVRLLKIESGLENEIVEIFSSINGDFGPIKLEEDADYIILVDKKEYLTKREDFTMYGRAIPQRLLIKNVTDTTFNTVVNLDKVFVGKTFRLENIYYDLDKFDIRPDAATELNKLVQILIDNPLLKIELGSHTDSRGSDIYNLRLSQKRAESAINYLISKGIERERLTAKGYGETELIVESAKTEEEHQVNRRTEFKVVEITESDSQ
jgi:peptidoglycan-associated lipoprotein